MQDPKINWRIDLSQGKTEENRKNIARELEKHGVQILKGSRKPSKKNLVNKSE
jgi:hypothetical protein